MYVLILFSNICEMNKKASAIFQICVVVCIKLLSSSTKKLSKKLDANPFNMNRGVMIVRL